MKNGAKKVFLAVIMTVILAAGMAACSNPEYSWGEIEWRSPVEVTEVKFGGIAGTEVRHGMIFRDMWAIYATCTVEQKHVVHCELDPSSLPIADMAIMDFGLTVNGEAEGCAIAPENFPEFSLDGKKLEVTAVDNCRGGCTWRVTPNGSVEAPDCAFFKPDGGTEDAGITDGSTPDGGDTDGGTPPAQMVVHCQTRPGFKRCEMVAVYGTTDQNGNQITEQSGLQNGWPTISADKFCKSWTVPAIKIALIMINDKGVGTQVAPTTGEIWITDQLGCRTDPKPTDSILFVGIETADEIPYCKNPTGSQCN